MTGSRALQDVPLGTPVSSAATPLATLVLDTGTSLDRAFSLVAEHLLAMPRVEVVTIALTTFAPEDETGWSVLILGFGQEVTDQDDKDVAARTLAVGVRPWAPGNRDQAPVTAETASAVVVRAATLDDDASSGGFMDVPGAVAW